MARNGHRGGRSDRSSRALSILQHLEPRLLLSDYYVDVNSPGPTRDGLSRETAFTDLQQILPTAPSGSRILVADGTYKPTQDADRTKSFILRNGVTLEGGYAGASDPSAPRNIALYETILSGDIGTQDYLSDNSEHVVAARQTDGTAVLDGITITSAYTYVSGVGGGMYNSQANPTVRNATFIRNTAITSGGAIYNSASSPTLINSVFIENNVTHDALGGAIYNGGGSNPTIINSAFFRNSAKEGGAIYNDHSSPILVNSAFVGNSVAYYGGAIYNASSSPKITNCAFSGNFSLTWAAALYNGTSSYPKIVNSVIWGNTARKYPQIYSNSTLAITYSDIQGGLAGDGNIDADPRFIRNPSPGADATWGTDDDDYGDLRLQAGSPAIDAGFSGAVPTDLKTDLASNPRIAGAAVDMGAYEFTPIPYTIAGTDSADTFYIRLAADEYKLQIWTGLTAEGEPAYRFDLGTLQSLTFATGAGDDRLVFDLESHLTIPLHIESTSATLDAPAQSVLQLRSLSISGHAKLQPGKRLEMQIEDQLQIAPQSALDLSDNTLVIRNGAYSALSALVKSSALTSSSASTNTGLVLQQIGPDIRIRLSYKGDLNLDGRVNADDYFYIDQGFLQKPQPPTYHDGDFNFDGKIDADDYFLIDQAFLSQPPPLSSPKPALSTAATKRPPRSALFSRKKLSHRVHRGHRG